MNNLLYIMTILLGVIIIGWLTVFGVRHLRYLYKAQKLSLRPAFRDFRAKIWMTLGLGIVFFGFYFLLVFFSSRLIDPEQARYFFDLIYKHPIEFIYLGLFIFALVSLSVYLVRMFIKYLFKTKRHY